MTLAELTQLKTIPTVVYKENTLVSASSTTASAAAANASLKNCADTAEYMGISICLTGTSGAANNTLSIFVDWLVSIHL